MLSVNEAKFVTSMLRKGSFTALELADSPETLRFVQNLISRYKTRGFLVEVNRIRLQKPGRPQKVWALVPDRQRDLLAELASLRDLVAELPPIRDPAPELPPPLGDLVPESPPPRIKMTCSDFLKELTDYLDGAMDAQPQAELEDHLQWCHNCYVVCNTTKMTIEIYRDSHLYELPNGLGAAHLPSLEHLTGLRRDTKGREQGRPNDAGGMSRRKGD